MDLIRRRPGLYLLLAALVAAGSVAAAGQQGATRGPATALQPGSNGASGVSSGGVFATPINVVALANAVGWMEAPPPTGAAESGEWLPSGSGPSEWAASGQGTHEAARRSARSAMRGCGHAAGLDRPTPELSRLCVYRL